MIEFKCENCGAKFKVKDEFAGKTGKCKNCGSSIKIPAMAGSGVGPSAPVPPSIPAATAQPTGMPQVPQAPTVVVQMQQPMMMPGTIGPAPKSVFLVVLLAMFTNCLQYFYLGQSGKGALFLVLDIFVWGPLIFFTCGLGLIGFIPYHLVLLIDSIVVAGRIKTRAISPWRFF